MAMASGRMLEATWLMSPTCRSQSRCKHVNGLRLEAAADGGTQVGIVGIVQQHIGEHGGHGTACSSPSEQATCNLTWPSELLLSVDMAFRSRRCARSLIFHPSGLHAAARPDARRSEPATHLRPLIRHVDRASIALELSSRRVTWSEAVDAARAMRGRVAWTERDWRQGSVHWRDWCRLLHAGAIRCGDCVMVPYQHLHRHVALPTVIAVEGGHKLFGAQLVQARPIELGFILGTDAIDAPKLAPARGSIRSSDSGGIQRGCSITKRYMSRPTAIRRVRYGLVRDGTTYPAKTRIRFHVRRSLVCPQTKTHQVSASGDANKLTVRR